ncbi:MAG: glycosyltransferase family 4 protein [Candidatus Omnitrophica bacterium]|nr:glycosyltransferase family 4 protein [Candidatus Omnitrophota bacterium]MDD5236047.1 glycosyltransferase family 4 protein [Candidatus Omnitrophota bacterium]MDD5609921.1 glycosyltransferase family 4 protein [Candidatus Omnitrophota bacterium]
MRKINLLYVITKLELGGAQKQLLSLIKSLDRERFNIFLFTCRQGLLLREFSSVNGLLIKRSGFLDRPVNPFKDSLALWEISSFIKNNKIDIVHTHSSKAGILGRLAARISGVKIILHTVHGWSFHSYQNKLVRGLFIRLERFCAKFSDRLIVVSFFDKQRGLENRIGNEAKYQVIKYGINCGVTPNKEGAIRRELGIAGDKFLVGTISCFKPQKAVDDFIKAAALVKESLPQVKFIVAGDGALRAKFEKLIKKLGLEKEIVLLGWRRDIPQLLSALDIFTLTSLWEGMPIAALEALACGSVVVATDTGGISEVIREGENGFLVPARDVKGLSEKITFLLKDDKLRKAIREKTKNSLGNNFTVERMAKETGDLYERLFKEASQAC